MSNLITIYHGSRQIIEVPTYGAGRKNNDFGLGFLSRWTDGTSPSATKTIRMGMEKRWYAWMAKLLSGCSCSMSSRQAFTASVSRIISQTV